MVRQWNALTEPIYSHYLATPPDGRCALFALFFRSFFRALEGEDQIEISNYTLLIVRGVLRMLAHN